MANDVEKRWQEPAAFRSAVTYSVTVIVVAAFSMAVFLLTGEPFAAVVVPAVLLLGGIAAFIQTYRVWRRGGTWPIWHGAGWFLFAVFLLGLAVPTAGLQ